MEGGHVVRVERAHAAALLFTATSARDLAAMRAELNAWNPAGDPPGVGATTLGTALRPHLRLYLLGLLSAKSGEPETALRYAQDVDALTPPAGAEQVVRALSATVRADVALRRDRAQEALTLLRDANGQVPLELVMVRPFVNTREYSQEYARFFRAEALLATGRDAEARRWLETSFQGSPLELVYVAPVRQRLAKLAGSR